MHNKKNIKGYVALILKFDSTNEKITAEFATKDKNSDLFYRLDADVVEINTEDKLILKLIFRMFKFRILSDFNLRMWDST